MTRVLAVLVSLVCGASACTLDRDAPTARQFGELLFNDARLSDSQFNSFSCATCHSTRPAGQAQRMFAGYTMYNAAARQTWWGVYKASFLDAVNFCYVYFMRGIRPLIREEPRSKALYEYLKSISPASSAPALPHSVVRDVADVPRGDPVRGESVYRSACATCHGDAHSGEGRINEDAVILPEYTEGYGVDFPGVAPSLVVIEKVRHGQFFGVGGNMPLYSLESLSDADLGALLAYLGL